ncbi:hypothetical protein F5879DRAFT_990290 [Lentinula edodes]|nr:hypothetical protein F5879DRAFT_990290 [Lentinula edodes]KAJ3918657.1 hypothetical protein F5877DRAFT_78808 [Lentinula edodes]
MGPDRTPKTNIRRRVSAPRSLPRRHNMLLRSITRSLDIQIPASTTPTTSLSAYMNPRSSVNEPSISPSSPSPGSSSDDLPVSDSARLICSKSSFDTPSISPSTSSLDPLSDDIPVSDELQSIDVILETMYNENLKRSRDEQEKSIDFATKYIEILTQQCSDHKEIIRLKHVLRKLDYSCPLCKNLAWNPQVCSIVWPHYVLKPNPSVTIQQVVERIATKLKISEPPRHELDWTV